MVEQFQLSERRACRLVWLSRDSHRNPPIIGPETTALSSAIVAIAHIRRRFGYRRIHDMLRQEFPAVNHKRVYRLYSAAKLAVRKRKKFRRPASERMPLRVACSVNEVWSMDFVSDCLVNGRRTKCLTVADDYSHECVDIVTDFGIGGEYVTRLLDQVALFREVSAGRPDGQRPGIYQPRIHRRDAKARDSPLAHRTGSPHAKWLHRELQRQIP
jgi:putative transposase